jgi:RNA polymerase sigma-70 factor (ECF subfamily)
MTGKQREARVNFIARREVDVAEEADTTKLITAFQAGDRESYAQIYSRYFDRVYAYLRVVLKDRHKAEDTAQQVFVQALEALPRYEHRRKPFEAWLFTIARNAALMLLRKESSVELLEPEDMDRVRERPVEDVPFPSWITDADLLVLMDRMPLAQRQVLALRYMLDLSATEIAEVLGRSPEAIRMQQSRAHAFLRARLAALGRAPKVPNKAGLQRVDRQAPVLRHRRWSLHL